MKREEAFPREDRTLEVDGPTLRTWTEQVLAHLETYLSTLDGQSMGASLPLPQPPAAEPLPQKGTPLPALLEDLFASAIPASYNTASPGYMAYVPGGGLPHAALADFIAGVVNRYAGVYAAAPYLAALEAQVLRWLADIMGLPEQARGLLTTGGSMANLTALVTARQEKLTEGFHDGVVYLSREGHHSIFKAARLAGIPSGQVRPLAVDEDGRLSLPALRQAVVKDREQGLRPFLVVGNAGSVNTGAVDDLAGLAAFCRREGLWLHVDAAYGGFFRLTGAGREVMAGIERADSVTLDPHKGLFLPYGTGALLVREGESLRRAHASRADYMPEMQDSGHPLVQDFCEYGPELSREWRGLRLWLPLKMHGIDPFVANLEEKLALARHAARRLSSMPGIEVMTPPQLSVVAFRLRRPGLNRAAEDALNQDLLRRIHARERVFLNTTLLGGTAVLRLCILSFRTHRRHVDEALDIIAEACRESRPPSPPGA